MTYSKATELLDITTPKSFKENAEIAKRQLSTMNSNTPLKYKVAASVIIEAAS